MKREADGTGAALPRFYGAAGAPPEIRALYEELRRVWAADTCAPRLIDGPLVQVSYPVSGGRRTAYLKDISNFEQN